MNGSRSVNPEPPFAVKRWRQNQPQVAFPGAAVWRCGNGRLARVCKQTGPVSCRSACAASSFREKQSAADTSRRGFTLRKPLKVQQPTNPLFLRGHSRESGNPPGAEPNPTLSTFLRPQNRSFRPVISALSGNPASRKNWIPRQAGNDILSLSFPRKRESRIVITQNRFGNPLTFHRP